MRAMPTTLDFPNVDTHAGAPDPAICERLEDMRGAVHAAAPDAVAGLQYSRPAHALGSESAVVACAARKPNIRLDARRPEILQAFAADVGRLNAGKACLRRGPRDDRSPAALARRLNAIAAAGRRGDLKPC